MVAEIQAPPNWMLISTCLHVAAFLLVALLAGRLATALVRTTVQLGGAKADAEAQLVRMRAVNEQLRVMTSLSRRVAVEGGRPADGLALFLIIAMLILS